MISELEEISAAAIDAVNYRVKWLDESLEDAVHAVEESLRARGIRVSLHLSTTSTVRDLHGENVAVYEVTH